MTYNGAGELTSTRVYHDIAEDCECACTGAGSPCPPDTSYDETTYG